ncbi:MAG TPA: hypothetical protein VMN81_06345 [Vicinamibacterales bacterium]|nr:hypothetical protein [Vicinamibacterales bacterium]
MRSPAAAAGPSGDQYRDAETRDDGLYGAACRRAAGRGHPAPHAASQRIPHDDSRRRPGRDGQNERAGEIRGEQRIEQDGPILNEKPGAACSAGPVILRSEFYVLNPRS